MRRADLTTALALAIGLVSGLGCMKIYPDPELPDLTVKWNTFDCNTNAGDLTITVDGVDDPSEHRELAAACADEKATFEDVSRQRFRIQGALHDANGNVYSGGETDADLRNGFNESAYLAFGGVVDFRVTWSFEGGGTCTSVGATWVDVVFTMGGAVVTSTLARCDVYSITGFAGLGIYDVYAEAHDSGGATVAVSPPISDVKIAPAALTDLGMVVLSPCGSACP